MRKISTLSVMALGLAISMSSCGDKPKPAAEAPAPVAAADTTAKAAAPAFTPYKAVLVTHTVKDFDKWFNIFKADSTPKSFGLSNPGVGRGLENDKLVVVINRAADVQKAKDFIASPVLKKTMGSAGVTSAPAISYLDVIYDDTTTIPQHERLMVTHHVKDFDTWKKGFDAEGAAGRAAHGLIERALARGVDDPNTVTILFAVTDLAKAKARAASPELKKAMTDVGVDGPPTITWFKWVL